MEGGALSEWDGGLSDGVCCCFCCAVELSSGGGEELEVTVLFGEVELLPSSSLLPLSAVLVFMVLTVSRSFFWTALGSSFSLSPSRGRGSRYPMEEEQRLPSLGLQSVPSDKGVKLFN